MDLKPISIEEFNKSMTRQIDVEDKIDFENYFKPCIEQANKFAVAPYFWLIPNQENMSLVGASTNIRELTPHTKEEWIKEDSFFWMNNFHPEDQGFLGAAITLAVKIQEEMPFEKVKGIRLNIYCRMLDANNKYRWVLIQFPERYFDKNGKIPGSVKILVEYSEPTSSNVIKLRINHFQRILSLAISQNREAISNKIDEVLNIADKTQQVEKLFEFEILDKIFYKKEIKDSISKYVDLFNQILEQIKEWKENKDKPNYLEEFKKKYEEIEDLDTLKKGIVANMVGVTSFLMEKLPGILVLEDTFKYNQQGFRTDNFDKHLPFTHLMQHN